MHSHNSHFTQVPNNIFDILLPKLTMAELKILLIIIRQTNGWLDSTKKKRKTRDRITHNQFIQKSGLSRRIVVATIQKLIDKNLIKVTDDKATILHSPEQRKGKLRLYYSLFLKQKHKQNIEHKSYISKSQSQSKNYKKVITLKQLLEQKEQSLNLSRNKKY